jgi:NhaP-type Na+/H+ or K+/H+ antiporter
MKIFTCFIFALINAGGSVGSNEVVTGHVLFSVVMSAAAGYMLGSVISDLIERIRDRTDAH